MPRVGTPIRRSLKSCVEGETYATSKTCVEGATLKARLTGKISFKDCAKWFGLGSGMLGLKLIEVTYGFP